MAANSWRRTSLACGPLSPSTTTFTRTSLVLIMSTLMPAAGQRLEHADGHAGVALHADAGDRELGHARGNCVGGRQPKPCGQLAAIWRRLVQVALRHGEGQVGPAARGPSSARSCRRRCPPSAISSKTWAASPGVSGTPQIVTRACDSSSAMSSIDQVFHALQPGDHGAVGGRWPCRRSLSGRRREPGRLVVQVERLVDGPQGLQGVTRGPPAPRS